MRVFRDLDLVEQLGSGVPRILEHYPRSIYHFTSHFIRLVLPYAKGYKKASVQATMQAAMRATMQDEKVIQFCMTPRSRNEIQLFLGLKNRDYFRKEILNPLIEARKLTLTIPKKPSSLKQRYIATHEKKENKK